MADLLIADGCLSKCLAIVLLQAPATLDRNWFIIPLFAKITRTRNSPSAA
jgi:hypothetical protein